MYLDYTSPLAIPFLFVQAVWLYISLNNAATLVRLYFYTEPPRSRDWAAEPPSVSVIVPLYREPPGLVAAFAEGLLGLSYPASSFEVVVVDDSPIEYSREYWKILAAASAEKGFRLNYIHREERRGYRGGAVKRGLESAQGEYVVVMDVDHVPLPHMLDEMVSVAEANPELDVVVFPQHFPEGGNVVEEASRMGYAFDYLFSRKGKSVTNSAFCVGTNWIARRERILGAGGYDDATIVEDAATSLKLWHPNGVKLGFAEALLAVGASPSSLQAWRLQQYRWSQGAFRLLPDLLAAARRLSIPQALDYLYLVAWYLVGPRRWPHPPSRSSWRWGRACSGWSRRRRTYGSLRLPWPSRSSRRRHSC